MIYLKYKTECYIIVLRRRCVRIQIKTFFTICEEGRNWWWHVSKCHSRGWEWPRWCKGIRGRCLLVCLTEDLLNNARILLCERLVSPWCLTLFSIVAIVNQQTTYPMGSQGRYAAGRTSLWLHTFTVSFLTYRKYFYIFKPWRQNTGFQTSGSLCGSMTIILRMYILWVLILKR